MAKKTLLFRKATKKKLLEKKAAGIWTGRSCQVPVLRLGGAAAITATSQSDSAHAVRTALWLCRESRQLRTKKKLLEKKAASTPDSKPLTTPLAMAEPGPKPSTERSAPARSGQECRASTPDPKPKSGPKRATKPSAPARSGKGRRASTPASEVIVVENTLDDMVRKRTVDPPTKDLLAWMRAIHAGHRVKCDAQEYALKSASQVPANVIIDKEFARKHSALVNATRGIADLPGCKWQVDGAPAAGTIDVRCTKKRDFIDFLLKVRRTVGGPKTARML